MAKLNKGDRVKALVNGIDYQVGDEFVLTEDSDGECVYFYDKAGDDRILPRDEFELLPVTGTAGMTNEEIGKAHEIPGVKSNTTRLTPLTIEAGRYYRTRDGRKVGPIHAFMDHFSGTVDGIGRVYQSDGRHGNFCIDNEPTIDLIAEWVEPQPAAPQAAEQQAEPFYIDATKAGPSQLHVTKGALVKTTQGYGFELARYGNYVWVDTGKKAPICMRAATVATA